MKTNVFEDGAKTFIVCQFSIPQGHHMYWNNAEFATAIQLKLPKNVTFESITWSTPEVDEDGDFVYNNAAYFIAQLSGTSNDVSATINFLECSQDSCIPRKELVSFETPMLQDDLLTLLRGLPQKNFEGTTKVYQKNNKIFLEMGEFSRKPDMVYFFHKKPLKQTWEIVNNHTIRIMLHAKDLSTLKGLVKIHFGNSIKSYLVSAPVGMIKTFWEIYGLPLIFAFLGGLLLNIMPCVLPVTSIKLLHILKRPEHPFRSAFLFSSGVILSFIGIAFALAFVKAAGHKVGWGFQLQSPFFVFFLCSVFLSLSLSLFGLFEIGKKLTRIPGYFPHTSMFFSGVLTTLVATPCTAPFMGTAISYAFTQSYVMLFLIFFCLGLGMSTPMLATPFIPGLNRVIPKPGNWIMYLKEILGFALLATLAWLVCLLTTLTNTDVLLWTLFALLVMAFALWLWEKVFCVAMPLFIIGFGLGLYQINALDAPPSMVFEPFSEARITQLCKTRKPILLTFTANWCLSCQVNHKVLQSKRVLEKMAEKNVIFMVGDWTKKDETIAEFLLKNEKVSIPFTVLYDNDQKYVLPQILTENTLLNALDKIDENRTISFSE